MRMGDRVAKIYRPRSRGTFEMRDESLFNIQDSSHFPLLSRRFRQAAQQRNNSTFCEVGAISSIYLFSDQ